MAHQLTLAPWRPFLGVDYTYHELYGWQDPHSGEVVWFGTYDYCLWRYDGPDRLRMVGMAEVRLPRVGWEA